MNKIDFDDWETIQQKINKYLVELLYDIEWHYGENRAPFIYPPIYETNSKKDGISYCCSITLEDCDNFVLKYESLNPSNLFETVSEDISKRFTIR